MGQRGDSSTVSDSVASRGFQVHRTPSLQELAGRFNESGLPQTVEVDLDDYTEIVLALATNVINPIRCPRGGVMVMGHEVVSR